MGLTWSTKNRKLNTSKILSFSEPDWNRTTQWKVDFNISPDCSVTCRDQSNALTFDNNSSGSIPSESSLLDCQVVLDDVFKHDYTRKYTMLNGSLDKTQSAPSHRSIEVGYLNSICKKRSYCLVLKERIRIVAAIRRCF